MSAPGGSKIDDSAGDLGQQEGDSKKLHREGRASGSSIAKSWRNRRSAALAGSAGGVSQGGERLYLTVEPSYGTSVWIRKPVEGGGTLCPAAV
jgi:hypothetical protein